LAVLALVAAGVLEISGSRAWAFLIGDGSPVVLTLVAVVLCLAGHRVLERRAWSGTEPPRGRTYAWLLALGAGLTLPVIIVDVFGGFPADLNVALPDALLFYPSIAFVAETAFHVLPLSGLAVVASVARVPPSRLWPFAAAGASLIEPVLQVAWGASDSPLWASAYVGLHLLVFNLIGVHVLRRHGFLAVWSYRMAYYLVWHITWGALRTGLLFGGGA
jgi:hypothetical protein